MSTKEMSRVMPIQFVAPPQQPSDPPPRPADWTGPENWYAVCRRLEQEAVERGGSYWREPGWLSLTPPGETRADQGDPITVTYLDDGNVRIDAGVFGHFYAGCDPSTVGSIVTAIMNGAMTETVEVTEDGLWLSATARVPYDGEQLEVRREDWAAGSSQPHTSLTWRVAQWHTPRR
jgi:hypothetical protein